MKKSFLYILPLLFSCISCIQDELPNSEADIVSCRIMDADGELDDNIKGDLSVKNNSVIVFATPRIDLKKLKPVFQLTPGATIKPESGTMLDFSEPQKYVVTSEDGKWRKEYTVSIDTSRLPVKYHFEYYETPDKYNVFYEMASDRDKPFKQYIWASGNPGYALAGIARKPEDFPTAAAPGEGIGPSCALKLITRTTGSFGSLLSMPIAAGNLFVGNFNAKQATTKPLEATVFGLPFDRKPVSLKGYYKYEAGKEFWQFVNNDRKQEYVFMPGVVDKGDIYAVLYESTSDMPNLNGANILDHPNIVAIARVPDVADVNEYKSFEVLFDYGVKGRKPFDIEKLRANKYNLAVVLTSSINGAYFAGAVGSTLTVDNVEVICEDVL